MSDKPVPRATTKRSSFKRVVEEDQDPEASFLYQPEFKERLQEYERGDFYFMSLCASCELSIPMESPPGHHYVNTVETPGLYGIESDTDTEFLDDTYANECVVLEYLLKVLNVEIIEDAPQPERVQEPAS